MLEMVVSSAPSLLEDQSILRDYQSDAHIIAIPSDSNYARFSFSIGVFLRDPTACKQFCTVVGPK